MELRSFVQILLISGIVQLTRVEFKDWNSVVILISIVKK